MREKKKKSFGITEGSGPVMKLVGGSFGLNLSLLQVIPQCNDREIQADGGEKVQPIRFRVTRLYLGPMQKII